MLPTSQTIAENRGKEIIDWAILTLGILSLSIAVAGTILTKTQKVSSVSIEETDRTAAG